MKVGDITKEDEWTEEIIHLEKSESWGREMPVKFIAFKSGEYSIHCQTGDHHYRAIFSCLVTLEQRGFSLGGEIMTGPTGIYYRLHKIPDIEQEKEMSA